jgi:acryloyl-coenzyme A reductase
MLYRRRLFSTARRVVLNEPGPSSSLLLESYNIDLKAPVRPKHVRVKVAACAVAYRDTIDRSGGFPFMNRPTVLGHEVSGVVVATNNTSLAIGDRVVSLHWAQHDGLAWPSPFETKEGMGSFLGLTTDGGYGEYIEVDESAFVKVDNHHKWSAVEAAPVMSTFGTVYRGAVIRGGLKAGERVLITGAAGGVGSAAITLASRLGAHVVAATGNVAEKGAMCTGLGAHEVIDGSAGFSKALAKSVGGCVDMVIECVGAPTFTDSLRSLKPGGRLILVGNVTNATTPLPLGLCIVKSLSVIGTDSIEACHLKDLFRWLEEHHVRPVIDSVLPLEHVAAAHDRLEKRSVNGRIVLDVNKDVW